MMAGLHEKYTVTRNDGKPDDGRRYFVLSPDTDPAALRALSAYAHAIRESNPALYADLYEAYPALRCPCGQYTERQCICN